MNKTAYILREDIAEIMERWKNQVIQDVPAAKETNTIALYDHLPNIIEDIAHVMERHIFLEKQIVIKDIQEDEKYTEILENSIHHGRHRATTLNYTVEQVVHEYIIFHHILIDHLKSNNSYNENISILLKNVIEFSILKSVGSFSKAVQEMQHKLVGTIAHDIRNPLSAASLLLEMVQENEDGEENDKMIKAVKRSVNRALSLIEGLMNGITVKAGQGMLLHFEEKDIIEDINWVHCESNEIYSNEINLECSAQKIEGIFDSTAVRRLLENLISNAVKYGSPKKPITITVIDKADLVEMSFHNYGNPIPAEKQKQIFKFMSNANNKKHSVFRSWEMGLTTAQMVVDAHGGKIKLVSTEEKGTTFTVTFLKHFNKLGTQRAKLNFAAIEM